MVETRGPLERCSSVLVQCRQRGILIFLLRLLLLLVLMLLLMLLLAVPPINFLFTRGFSFLGLWA